MTRSIYHVGEQSVDDAGLSYAQYRVLMHLFFAEQMGDRAELNPSEISDRQGVSRNTMSAFIRNLEEAGLVERRLDPSDRRRFNISLTDAGRAVVSEHTHHHLETIDHFFSALSSAEQDDLLNLLQKLSTQVAAVEGSLRKNRTMLRLRKYLKPYTLLLAASIILLFIQAMLDLALPDYLAQIVNTGVQLSGIESAVSEAVSSDRLEQLALFMSADDEEALREAYTLRPARLHTGQRLH